MQVFHPSVTAIYIVTMISVTFETNQADIQTQQNQNRSISPQPTLATSRLYLPDARLNFNANSSELHPGGRYAVPKDWYCDSIIQWRDLGEFHYPRFVKQRVCTARQCYNDFFSCVPQYYPLTVLKRRDREITNDEMALPVQLRNRWMFEQVQVSVACICGA